ncbi:MAG: trimeric intracellular cation channel family protein [Hyphomonadaceae bacterium]|nr:trimeric intracellular cation channel family protein [Hyphomonadaceae bacterium]
MIDGSTSRDALQAMVLALDLCGAFAFAVLGALAAARKGLDLFGVLTVAFIAAAFGGIARDLLIGATPPAALTNTAYLAVSTIAGAIAYWAGAAIERAIEPLRLLDAAGLAFFAVAGAQKALAFGLDPVMAAMLGMLTGIGGGIARDVLLAEVPSVLRPTEIYALAALAGAGVVAVGAALSAPAVPAAILGGATCFALRALALRFGWRLPTAPWAR